MISKFIWQNKRPRIKLKTLQLSKSDGGLKLPNLKYYFWASQMKPLITWIQNDTQTRWLNIEKNLSPDPLQTLPFLEGSVKGLAQWTMTTLKVWRKIMSAFGLPKLSPLASIGFVKSFIPNNLDSGFRKWANHRLVYLHQLLEGNNLKSFEQIKNDFNLDRTDFFRYLQLRTFLTTHKEWRKITNHNPIEKFLIEIQLGRPVKKIIGKLYDIFLSMSPHNTLQIKQRWGTEADEDISQDTWMEVCTEAHLATNSNTWREFKWKVITRVFRTPVITAKMNPACPSSCWRDCGTNIPNHTHVFWSCPKLSIFWKDVFDALRQVFQQDIPQDLAVAVLGVIPIGLDRRAKKYLLNILLTAALKCITIRWMKPDPPTYNIWIQKVWDIYQMERITYILRLQEPIFTERWRPALVLLMQ